MQHEKIINDAIFGFIKLKPYILTIIDTLEFQRLRWIWQLGPVPFVYPTADHSRFEHSIGTYYLASRLVTKLQKQLEEENAEIRITDKDIKCVEVAALCHDIGHGPFSHLWDNVVLPNILAGQDTMKHEDHFLHVWNSKFKHILKDEELNQDLIYALIKGKVIEGKEILSTIVSNSESGMDVDKWDYLARDASYLGHSSTNYRIDVERMIHFTRAIKDTEDGKWKIAFRKSEGLNMIRVFQLRHYMHKTAYQHKTVIAIEQMMLDGFKRIFTEEGNGDLLNKIGTSDWILKNCDSIFLQNVDRILEFQRILQRDLYKLILEVVVYKRVNNPTEEIIEYLRGKGHKTDKDKINGNHVIRGVRFGFSKFELGSTKERDGKNDWNPLSNIPFYKNEAVNEIFRYTDETVPSYLRCNVDESRIMAFVVQSKEQTMNENAVVEEVDKSSIVKDLETFFSLKNDKVMIEREKWIFEK